MPMRRESSAAHGVDACPPGPLQCAPSREIPFMDKTFEPGPIEARWRAAWEDQGCYAPSGQGEPYSILIPPPNVTGTLHMGHAFQHTIMDALIRHARMSGREEGLTTWIRAATADGRLKGDDPLFAAMQLQGMVKGFAFWPQVTLDQPPLTPARQKQVAESAVDMFLAYYEQA
jgi:hypothetical protein